jgi:hypothetical protein
MDSHVTGCAVALGAAFDEAALAAADVAAAFLDEDETRPIAALTATMTTTRTPRPISTRRVLWFLGRRGACCA